jgi:hypothetical protein
MSEKVHLQHVIPSHLFIQFLHIKLNSLKCLGMGNHCRFFWLFCIGILVYWLRKTYTKLLDIYDFILIFNFQIL